MIAYIEARLLQCLVGLEPHLQLQSIATSPEVISLHDRAVERVEAAETSGFGCRV